MSSIKEFVDNQINSNKVMVFSGSYCPYCTKAKNTFANYKLNGYKVIELDKDNTFRMDDVMVYLEQLTGGATVPRVFVNGKFLGGGDDTAAAHQSGKLRQLLTECGALQE